MKILKSKKIITPAIIIVLLALYCITITNIKDRLPGDTYINNKDCSFMTFDKAADVLTQDIAPRKIIIKNSGEQVGEIDAKDYAAMSFKEETIAAIAKNTPTIDKIFFFLYGFHYNLEPEVIVSSEALNNLISEFGGTQSPSNAYIEKDADENTFHIVPEENGNMIDTYTAEEILIAAIEENESEADISAAFIKAGVLATDDRLIERTEKLNKDFEELTIKLIYKDGASTKTTVLKDNELFSMYKADEHGVPYFTEDNSYEVDMKLVREYVSKAVPEDYQAVANTEQEDANKEDSAAASKKNVTETNKPTDRESKIEELSQWIYEMLSKCKSGNKTF